MGAKSPATGEDQRHENYQVDNRRRRIDGRRRLDVIQHSAIRSDHDRRHRCDRQHRSCDDAGVREAFFSTPGHQRPDQRQPDPDPVGDQTWPQPDRYDAAAAGDLRHDARRPRTVQVGSNEGCCAKGVGKYPFGNGLPSTVPALPIGRTSRASAYSRARLRAPRQSWPS